MSRSLRQIKSRIRSIENTKKVTSAMEMISVSKMNRIENKLRAFNLFFTKFEGVLANFSNNCGRVSSPLFEEREEKKNIALCLITSDGGLCGMYNAEVIQKAEEFIRDNSHKQIRLIAIGKKGFNYFKNHREITILDKYTGLNGRYSDELCRELTDVLANSFLSGQADEVYVVYTHFITALLHKVIVKKLFNLGQNSALDIEYIMEPGKERILEEIVPRYLLFRMKLILLEAFTSEHSARTIAMKTATDNAKELLEDLTLLRNKVRQANITQDIMEIVGSTEALKQLS